MFRYDTISTPEGFSTGTLLTCYPSSKPINAHLKIFSIQRWSIMLNSSTKKKIIDKNSKIGRISCMSCANFSPEWIAAGCSHRVAYRIDTIGPNKATAWRRENAIWSGSNSSVDSVALPCCLQCHRRLLDVKYRRERQG